jgi:DNA polymerase-3 subunit epsilon
LATTLQSTAVIVLDCQSTGASPKHGELLELAWLVVPGDTAPDIDAIVDSCVRLSEGHAIPPVVRELTGISDAEVAAAPDAGVLWPRVLEAARAIAGEGGALAPIHYARFERSFFDELHPRIDASPSPLDIVCTHEIARRLFPGMPRLGLRALAGYFGHGAAAPRRSREHVWATALVWRALVGELAQRGVTTRDELATWSAVHVKRSRRREYPMDRGKRLGLPEGPGVYRMLRSSGDVLYVGKATSLRRRVNSYFQKQSDVPDRLLEMLTQARDLDVTPTATVLEAALLEHDEIKRLVPPFNVALVTGRRAAWYCSRALVDVAPGRTWRRRLGPFGSPWPARRLASLRAAVERARAGEDPTDALQAALGGGDRAPLAPEIATVALQQLLVDLGGGPLDHHAVARLGAAWWTERDAEVPAEPEPEPESESESDGEAGDAAREWTADDAHREARSIVTTFAWAMRRAAWLRLLADAVIEIVDGTVARTLVVRGAEIVARSDGITDGMRDPSPSPPPGSTRGHGFDLVAFDRVRVLGSELRRICSAGGRVCVRTAMRAPLEGERLRRRLAWV